MDPERLLRRLLKYRASYAPKDRLYPGDPALDLLALLDSILKHGPTGIAVVSGPGQIFRLASPGYLQTIPHADMEVVGRPFRDVWPPDDGFIGDRMVRMVLETGKKVDIEHLEKYFPDGTHRTFSFNFVPILWQDEKGVLILVTDTTQAHHTRQMAVELANEANRQAEELETIITAMAEAVVLFNAGGKAVKSNPATVNLFGINPNGMDGTELVEALAMRNADGSPLLPDELPSFRALRDEVITGQLLLFIDAEGRECVVRVSASPLYNESGLHGVVTVWHDVTERERLVEQLEIEQSRLATIIDNTPNAILVVDEEGRFVLGNPAAEQVLGVKVPYGKDVTQHQDMHICYTDGMPYDPRYLPLTRSALDGERINSIELLVAPPGGQTRHILASTAPIIDQKGNINGAVGVFQDISQRKAAEEALRLQSERSHLLASLSQAYAEAGVNYQELLETIVKSTGTVFGDFCGLHIFNKDTLSLYLAAAFFNSREGEQNIRNPGELSLLADGDDLTEQVLKSAQTVRLHNAPIEQFQASIAWVRGSLLGLTAKEVTAAGIPMRAHGRWVGVLTILRLQSKSQFQDEEVAFLQDLAGRAALAVEDARLYEREAQRSQELQALHNAASALLSTIDLESMLGQIMETARKAIPHAQKGLLCLFARDTEQLEVRAAFGLPEPDHLKEIALSAIQAALKNDTTTIRTLESSGSSYSVVAAPLSGPEETLGALLLLSQRENAFTKDDQRLLDSFAATAAAALHNATLHAEIQRLAAMDTLTGQYNRRKFFELGEMEIHRSRRLNIPLSAIMFDLDTFKGINDTHGHAIGDAVLNQVAQRVRNSIRVVDILGRYGGDEFAVLLPNATLEAAGEIAERIRQAVDTEPIPTTCGDIHVAVSMGVTQAVIETDNLSSLLGRADSALYAAKQNGRNRIEFQ